LGTALTTVGAQVAGLAHDEPKIEQYSSLRRFSSRIRERKVLGRIGARRTNESKAEEEKKMKEQR